MTGLTFDAARHEYAVDGRALVSVTSALTEAGLIDARWFTEEAAIRGTAIHAAIARLHAGSLDVTALSPVLQPYVAAYQRFLRESGFTAEASEEQVADVDLGAAGTLDLRGHLPRGTRASKAVDLIDVKTGAVPLWVGYQTAAYARMLPADLPRLRWRWCLQLCPDGTYRLHPLTKATDERVFLAALTVAQAKRGWL
jgi:hypothetical protein